MLLTSLQEVANFLGWNKKMVQRRIKSGRFPTPLEERTKKGWGVVKLYKIRVWDSKDLEHLKKIRVSPKVDTPEQ